MIITDSSIQMASQRTAVEIYKKRESLNVWQDNPTAAQSPENNATTPGLQALSLTISQQAVTVSISAEAMALQTAGIQEVGQDSEIAGDAKLFILKLLVERLTGRKIKLINPGDLRQTEKSAQQTAPPQQPAAAEKEGWGLIYDYYESHYQSESVQFTASGTIKTVDGREVEFNVSLNMSHEFMSEQSLNIRAGDALKDPLVINFNGTAAELTETSFSFDIDLDGQADQIAQLGVGSGFLALDRNDDGRINDGSELFGPTTGDGFSELARYDDDKNSWIDENDAIYDRLRIWTKDGEGKDQLFLLGQRGIGALFLGHINTPFNLRDSANELLGAVRSSGIYLREEGTVGSMQQLDLVV
ncbi:MAG: hypothetical protein A2521_13870 [Deltaproteobacteria bacterium RIFOXYD12_FULL_57_12]|nr:MAG: hypothetical protein A2521_13870 [Deltaproteobacteria bacterium RIFOXYD12_FULL_57_12]